MRQLQIDLTQKHPYLERHAQRYFERRKEHPNLALDSLQRAASYAGIFEFQQDFWTEETEQQIVQILTQIQRQKH